MNIKEILKKTVFIAHPDKELNLDEEASVYTTAEEAAEDLCANYVTEALLLKTRPKTEILSEFWLEKEKSETAKEAADGS